MTRAGKEPAEDAKRAFVRAIKQAGLRVHRVEMFKGGDTPGRFVFGTANPEGWAHECPAIELRTFVDFTGEIGPVEIRCSATDDDPIMNVFSAPNLRGCSCELAALPETLEAVWQERQAVLDWVKQAERDSRFVGRWVWEAAEEPDVRL